MAGEDILAGMIIGLVVSALAFPSKGAIFIILQQRQRIAELTEANGQVEPSIRGTPTEKEKP